MAKKRDIPQYGHYILGIDLAGNDYFPSVNPADTRQVLGYFPHGTKTTVDLAVQAAKEVFPKWKALGMVKRAEYLWRVARLLEDRKEEIARTIAKESGKQINESLADANEALHMVQWAFSIGHLGERGRVVDDEIPEKFCMEILEPRGIVASIGPWNFPVAIPVWLTLPALVFGNVVILKPAEQTPLCARILADIFKQAFDQPGDPRWLKSVFQVVFGDAEAGKALVEHPGVNTVLFTGSYQVGSWIKETLAKFPNKNYTIETGSKSGLIILRDAPMDLAVQAAIASAFKTSGQRCVSAGRLIIEEPIFEEFVDKFLNGIAPKGILGAKQIQVGDPFDPKTFYGPMIDEDAVKKGQMFNAKAKEEGFDILLDRNDEKPPNKYGYWLRPFVYTGSWRHDSFVLREEAFSPHVALIPAKDREDAVRIFNDTDYGLAASVLTPNLRKMFWSLMEIDAGVTYGNLPCIGAGVRMAFGGRKKSGNLIPSAAGLTPAITAKKAITINLGQKIQMAQGLKLN